MMINILLMHPVVYMLDKTNRQDNSMLLKHLIPQSLVEIEQLQSKHEENQENYQMLLEGMYNHHLMIHMNNQVQHNINLPDELNSFVLLMNSISRFTSVHNKPQPIQTTIDRP